MGARECDTGLVAAVTADSGAPSRPAIAGGPQSWLVVTRQVATDRIDQMVFLAIALAVGFGYSVLLPFDFTQRISFANWHYLDARYLVFTVAFALGMAWVLTLQVHAMRRIARDATRAPARHNGPVGALAAVVSLLPSFLCCSPVVPTVVSLFGLSAATRLHTTGRIQYFFATKQDWLLIGALALLVASGLWSTRKLARARCLAEQCRPVPTDTSVASTTPTPESMEPSTDEEPLDRAPVMASAEPEHEHESSR
jgi:hypothetical protein